MKPDRKPMQQRVEPCGCIVTLHPGNVNTMMCYEHQRQHFALVGLPMSKRSDIADLIRPNNLDLIGG